MKIRSILFKVYSNVLYPWKRRTQIKINYIWYKSFRGLQSLGENVLFGSRLTIDSARLVVLGDNVVLGDDTWIFTYGQGDQIKIKIGSNTLVGRRCSISAADSVTIGENVLLGPNVFISDHTHAYEDVSCSIKEQGITKILPVFIGNESWLGANVVIMPGVRIGTHCVVGSNSVVTKSVPDYSVVVGSPARVIRRFVNQKGWILDKSGRPSFLKKEKRKTKALD